MRADTENKFQSNQYWFTFQKEGRKKGKEKLFWDKVSVRKNDARSL